MQRLPQKTAKIAFFLFFSFLFVALTTPPLHKAKNFALNAVYAIAQMDCKNDNTQLQHIHAGKQHCPPHNPKIETGKPSPSSQLT
jgi:hypothetical protein